MTKVSIALLHHPVVDKSGEIYTTAITNMDVHDIARTARSYEVEKYFLVSPIKAQREMALTIKNFWTTASGAQKNPDRKEALSIVEVVPDIESVISQIKSKTDKLLVVSTSAKQTRCPEMSFNGARNILAKGEYDHLLLLFGTGFGLAQSILDLSDLVLEPVYGRGNYNHLSVRSAVAIIIDRLLKKE